MPSLTKVQTGFLDPQGALELIPGTASAPGLRFSTSSATGMFSPSAGVLGFSTGSTQNALTILSNGNVGIGTTNPQYKFHIHGRACITDGTGTNQSLSVGTTSSSTGTNFGTIDVNGNMYSAYYLRNNNNSTFNIFAAAEQYVDLGTITNIPLHFKINDSRVMSIVAGGNVGIGSTNPQAKLDVAGGILSTGITVSNGVRAATIGDYPNVNGELPNPSILFGTSGSYPLSLIGDGGNGATSGGVVVSYYSMTNGWRRAIEVFNTTAATGNLLLMKTGGNVGIGTTNPQDSLHVYGSNSDIIISNTSTGSAGLYIRYLNGTEHGTNLLYNPGSAVTYLDNTYPVVAGTVYGDMYFRQNVAGTMTNRIVIKAATGRIGIGTNTPTLKFHVYDSNTVARFESSSSYVDLQLSNSVSSVGFIQYNGGDLRFFASSGSTPSITIQGGSPGNVGIGTTNPEHPLEVNGIASLGTSGSYGYKIRYIGAISNGTTFTLPSGRWQGELHYTWGNNSGRTAKRIVSFAKAPGAINNGYSSTWLDVNNGGAGVLAYSFDQSTGVFTWSVSDGSTSTGYAWILYHPGN